MKRKRIAVVGTGAVGGYYGGLLALAGEDVEFLFRRDLAAVRAGGLVLRTREGERRLANVRAHGSTAEIGTVDVVLVAMKATGNGELPVLLAPLVRPGTLIVNLQNGLGAEEPLLAAFPAAEVAGMLCFVCNNRVAPGVIENSHPGYVVVGPASAGAAPGVADLADRLVGAGVKAKVTGNLEEARWRKLMWNVPFNGLAIAGGGITTDRIMADPDLIELAGGLMDEVMAGAAAHGHVIEPAFREAQFRVTRDMGPYKPSSLVDYLEGREVEVEAIWGEPSRRAGSRGAAVPRLEALYRLLGALTRAAVARRVSGGA